MNIFNREKQHIKTQLISKNFVVTPLLYSLNKSISTIGQSTTIKAVLNSSTNPALAKIKNYLNNLKNKSTMFTNSEIIIKSKINNINTNNTAIQQNNLNITTSPTIATTAAAGVTMMDGSAVKLNKINNKDIDLSSIESMPGDDNFTIVLEKMAKSINQKNLTKSQLLIKQQKLNAVRIAKLRKRLELRNYLKSLYIFKPNLAFNHSIVYKFNKNAAYAYPSSTTGVGKVAGATIATLGLKNLYYILKNSFLTFNCIISKPILEVTPNQIKIKLFYYNSKHIYTKNYILKELEYLCINLSKIMNISVVLDLVELQSYQLEGHILANSISIITDKLTKNFRRTANNIFENTIIMNTCPGGGKVKNNQLSTSTNIASQLGGNKAIAFLTGINIKLAGRLTRQPMIPRKTVKTIQTGSLARRNTDFLTISKYTAKNRRGIFSYTITIGHKFY